MCLSAILNFVKVNCLRNFQRHSRHMRRHNEFRIKLIIGGLNIVITTTFTVAASTMLNLFPVYFLTHPQHYGGKACLYHKLHTNQSIDQIVHLYSENYSHKSHRRRCACEISDFILRCINVQCDRLIDCH